jgi:hypothetical protein
MLKKERWIVYPLLMLSLFSSLVGVQVIKAQQEIMGVLTVRGIQVVNEKNTPVMQIMPKDSGGLITFFDEKGILGVGIGANSEYRGLVISKPNGEAGIAMGVDENGGSIEAYGEKDTLALRITPSMLTYYRNHVTGARMAGSELSRDGLKVNASTAGHAYYKSDGISHTGNNIFGFKLPRNITN